MRQLILILPFLICSLLLNAQTGVIQGRVFNSLNNEPLPFANIIIMGTETGATTDIDGNYTIKNLNPGLYSLKAVYVGFKEQTAFEILVTNAKPAVANFAMEESAKTLEEVVVKADPFRQREESPNSVQTLGIAEIERNAGANRDISKVIQSLPGVASTVSFRNDIIIRGGGPNENRFYLDGIEVPVINHFSTQGASGGPVGMINVNFLKEATLYTGAFPANRGNTLSSVLELTQKDGRSDRLGGSLTVGASDLGLTVEGPIGEKTTFIASARRSYLQFLFGVIGLPFLPTYTDAQFKVKFKPTKNDELTLIGLGAIDEFKLNLDADETEEQRYILSYLPVSPQWNYTIGGIYKKFRKNGYFTFVASRSMLNNSSYKYKDNDESDPENLILDYNSVEAENKFRIEHTTRTGDYKINYGVNYEFAHYTNSTYNKIFTAAGPVEVDYASLLNMHKWGIFAQASRTLFSRLTLSLGIRSDANSYSSEMSNLLKQVSPRVSASYAVTEKLEVNFNTGIYYQLPPYTILGYRNENGLLVNKVNNIDYIKSTHYVGGFGYTLSSNTRITVEGFLKNYTDYPFLLRDSITLANLGGDFGVVGNEPAVSTSEGRAYGVEFFLQQKLFKGFYGLLSYTFVRSEFEDKNGELIPSAWDYKHLLSVTGGKKFKRNWEVGFRFRYGAGAPYTPDDIAASSMISAWNIRNRALPDYDRLNTLRLDPYHNLDLRVDKKYFWKKISLNFYLDIQNVYNFQQNLPDILVAATDENGNYILDPDDMQRYQMKYLPSVQGTVLPTLGIILEY